MPSTSALLHNITTAIGDVDLAGDVLIAPVRKCRDGYRYAFSALNYRDGICQRTEGVFKRCAVFGVATLVAVPSIVLASIGTVSKLIDLYRKFEEKVSLRSEVGVHIPMVLEPFSRTGDRTAAYLRARVIADVADMALYYQPFKGSEMFAFHTLETNRGPKYYRKVVYLNTADQVHNLSHVDKNRSTLYLVPFAPFNRELDKESAACFLPKYQPDWSQHRGRLRQLLRIQSEKLDLPADTYAIALHIRDGGDYDDNNTKTLHPLKLPSLNFYIGELIRVIGMKKQEGQNNFFIHIFTDALRPENVCDQVRHQVHVEDAEIVFSYTPRDRATLQYDAGNMHRFNCMIRADSNLSGPIVAASNTELDIFPSGFDTRNHEIIISEVSQEERGRKKTHHPTCYRKPMVGWLPLWFNRFFYRYFGVYQVPLSDKRRKKA